MQSSQLNLKNMVGQLFDEEEVVSVPEPEVIPKEVVVESTEITSPSRKSFSLKKTKQEPKYKGKSALLEQQHNPLFGGGTLTEIPVIPESKQESFQEICDRIQETYPDNPNNKELIEKVSNRLSETTHNPFRSSTEQVSDTPKEYSENLMNTVGGFLSDTAKFDDEEIERSYFEERFDFVQKQLEGMKRSILENTVVSGIGHGMYGSSSGGGEVLLNKMDDVAVGEGPIPDKHTLIWDASQEKWITADVYNGLISVSTTDVDLASPVDITRAYNDLRFNTFSVHLDTQEDANILNVDLLETLDTNKPDIIVGDGTYFRKFVFTRDPSTEPDGTQGDIWVDGLVLKVYMDGAWTAIRSDGPFVHMQEEVPDEVDVTEGDFWFNTSTGGMSIYYTDADSSQWVSVTGYDSKSTTTTIESLQVQITNLQTRLGDLENDNGGTP